VTVIGSGGSGDIDDRTVVTLVTVVSGDINEGRVKNEKLIDLLAL
jgi:hypothetical protein